MQRTTWTVWAVFVFAVLAGGAAKLDGQQGGEKSLSRLDVTVLDRAGKPAIDLRAEAFSVTDNGRRRAVRQATAPKDVEGMVEAFLVLDRTNTSAEAGTTLRQQLEKQLLAMDRPFAVPVSLIALDEGPLSVFPPTSDPATLIGQVQASWKSERIVITGSMDRMNFGLAALGRIAMAAGQRPGRKALIWLSTGWQTPYVPPDNLGVRQREEIFNRAVKISGVLREARARVFMVNPEGMSAPIPLLDPELSPWSGSGAQLDARSGAAMRQVPPATVPFESFVEGAAKPAAATTSFLGLQVIAVQSGGKVFEGGYDMVRGINDCLNELQNSYELTLEDAAAGGGKPGGAELHRLEVKVPKGLSVRAPRIYYTER